MLKVLAEYKSDLTCNEVLQLPTTLNGSLRKVVHDVSDELELGHKSKGRKKNKRICVFKSLEDFQKAIK